jgi:ArsR family transcriptional regulator
MVGKCCRNKKSILEIEDLAKILKKISEPNRLKILCFLKKEPRCVCDIWKCLKLPQNLVSHHLAVLKRMNLVFSKKVGQKVFYRLNKKTVKKYLKRLEKTI